MKKFEITLEKEVIKFVPGEGHKKVKTQKVRTLYSTDKKRVEDECRIEYPGWTVAKIREVTHE